MSGLKKDRSFQNLLGDLRHDDLDGEAGRDWPFNPDPESIGDPLAHVISDGGRAAAGYRGRAGDCVTRAIAIATGASYSKVYRSLKDIAIAVHLKTRVSENWDGTIDGGGNGYDVTSALNDLRLEMERPGANKEFSPKYGVVPEVESAYMRGQGWRKLDGENTRRLHLHKTPAFRFPKRCVAAIPRHLVAIVDGAIHDTFHDYAYAGVVALWLPPDASPHFW